VANDHCMAKTYCKLYGTHKCHEFCDPYVILKAIYSQTNLPKRYQYDRPITPSKRDEEAFDVLHKWKLDVVDHVDNGDNLYIWSEGTGNGKTTWAGKIANYFIRKMMFKGEIEDLVVYLSVSKFLEDYRDNYSTRDDDFAKLREKALNAKILILDDIGAEKSSEWVHNRLYDIINYREGEMRTIIYTSNLSIEEVAQKLDKRIISRLKNSTQVQLVGPDRREMNKDV